jgi:starvation-inducible DNA-binding protein
MGTDAGVAGIWRGVITCSDWTDDSLQLAKRAIVLILDIPPPPEWRILMPNGDNSKKALADALNGLLADYYALYLKTKNFHWHVTGPHFREYHLLFDEQATELIATTDLVAERVRKLGQDTLTSIGAIAAKQRIKDHDSTSTDAAQMLKALHADNESLIQALKEAKDLADEAGDNATDGLLDDWTDEAEQRAWFLAATIGKA